MKKIFLFTFLIVLFFPSSQGLVGSDFSGESDLDGEEIVIYLGKDKAKSKRVAKDFKNVKKDLSEYGVLVVDSVELPNVRQKKNRGEVVSYSKNQSYKTFLTPNDTRYAEQWALPKISAPSAWDITTGSNEVVVAVLDTGFKLDHEDLTGRFINGQDFIGDNDDKEDPSLPSGGGESVSHATLVSGVIAANTNNSLGVAGLDWSVKIMPIRVMDNDGNGSTATIAAGINYAVENGANVINMSLGYDYKLGKDALEGVINNAYSAGLTLVAASGNKGNNIDSTLHRTSYPAAYENVIAVGSSDSNDVRSPSSNYGPELDVVAPGVSILSTRTRWLGGVYTDNEYGSASGTSLAAPYVSGLVSLLLSKEGLSPAQVKDRIISSADKVSGMSGENRTDHYGHGRINVYNSLANVVTTITDAPNISLNSFRVTMEDISNPDSYVLARFPAVGEPVSVRPGLRNNEEYSVVLENIRIRGTLSSGTRFVVGTIPSLTLPANSVTAVPVQSFNISSFFTHTFSIDYEVDGRTLSPYVRPAYSYQQINAHFPNVRSVKTPAFVPREVDPYQPILGVYKIKNFDDRPAYLRSVMLRAELGRHLFYFRSDAVKINPGEVYYYEASVIPFRQGLYDAYAHITYGNGSQRVPVSLLRESSYSNFRVK